MTDNLRIFPVTFALQFRPEGVKSFPAHDRQAWLEMRRRDVTASVAAALFGSEVHPYVTPYGLWALKSGTVAEDNTETPAMRRGRLLEPVALEMLREDYPTWQIDPCGLYYTDPEARLGGTPDAIAIDPTRSGFGIVQIKTAGHFAFKKGWSDGEGGFQTPLWIAVQATTEAMLTGASWAAVAVLALGDGGLDLHVEEIPLRARLTTKMRELTADFWRRVSENDPYPFDYGRDAGIIARLYAEDDGSEIDLSGNNEIAVAVARWTEIKSVEKAGSDLEKEKKDLEARIKAALQNSTRARLANGLVISAPTTRRKESYTPASTYRTLSLLGPDGKKVKHTPADVTPANGIAPMRQQRAPDAASAIPDSF